MSLSLLSRFFKDKDALHCLLLPVTGTPWVIPSAAGAEVLTGAFSSQKRSAAVSPYEWRKESIPLVSAELLLGNPQTENAHERVIVLHSRQKDTTVPFWALELQSLPQIMRLTHSDIALVPEQNLSPYIQAKVILQDKTEAYIPSLEKIEHYLAEHWVTA